MSQNPILKVLSTFQKCGIQSLLMGGQACIFYGAAEFSRDTDFAILHSEDNLERLRRALRDLKAEQVFLPPLESRFLLRGHACHFRCKHADALGFRIDVMSVMRGCDPFEGLWSRRELVDIPGLAPIALLSLPDLVLAKKTQRDKDWPMIRRLVEADFERNRSSPAAAQVRFWIRESRTPAHLIEIAKTSSHLLEQEVENRPLLRVVEAGSEEALQTALLEEQEKERALDREYWKPLRAELEEMRRSRGVRS